MNQQVLIPRALCLPVPDIEGLIQGRIIVALGKIHLGHKFALYPVEFSSSQLSYKRYYCLNFLEVAQNAVKSQKPQGLLLQPQQLSLLPQPGQLALPLLADEVVKIKAWAKCEFCQILHKATNLELLSQLTIWTPEALQEILQQHQYIFLAYLRVYRLSHPQEVSAKLGTQEKLGKFVGLPNSLMVLEANPVLSDRAFSIRKHQLETLQPPLHPELEELLGALAFVNNPAAKQLEANIQVFLGWNNQSLSKKSDTDLDWINTVAALGDRSIEQEEKKSNYQAGTDFENITRRSLEFLGFVVEEAYKGGAGGLDLFCSKPYPLVSECKAGKLIPSRTVEELLKLGGMHLGKAQLLSSAKLIIGPGNPSPDTLKAARQWEISIINAMTLQKLVEFHAKYPGSINLLELKQYLNPGQIDEKIQEYLDKLEQQIKLRSHIISSVKQLGESERGYEAVEIRVQYNAMFVKETTLRLEDKAVEEILVELSSPLIGYLGRIKGDDWKRDRFYFLRDLSLG